MNASPSISVVVTEQIVVVRVSGRGSFQNSPGLRDFSREMIERGSRNFVVDLRECTVMDSTFMGTLAGVALKLRDLGQGVLRVINLNERCEDLLTNLGLDQLMTLGGAESSDENQLALALEHTADKQTTAEAMLEAHEAVVAANPENAAKFKDVLEYLRQDLKVAQG